MALYSYGPFRNGGSARRHIHRHRHKPPPAAKELHCLRLLWPKIVMAQNSYGPKQLWPQRNSTAFVRFSIFFKKTFKASAPIVSRWF